MRLTQRVQVLLLPPLWSFLISPQWTRRLLWTRSTTTTVDDTGTSTVEERNRIAAKLEDHSIYGPASPTAVSDIATVDTSDMTTVVTHDRSTVVQHKDATVDTPDTTTVDMSTDISKSPTKETIAAADTIKVATVDDINVATVVTFDPSDARSTPSPEPSAND